MAYPCNAGDGSVKTTAQIGFPYLRQTAHKEAKAGNIQANLISDQDSVYMMAGKERFNCLHGYKETMDAASMRDTITPLEENRNLTV